MNGQKRFTYLITCLKNAEYKVSFVWYEIHTLFFIDLYMKKIPCWTELYLGFSVSVLSPMSGLSVCVISLSSY